MESVNFKATFKRQKDQEWECGGTEQGELMEELEGVDGFQEVEFTWVSDGGDTRFYLTVSVASATGTHEIYVDDIELNIEGNPA